MSVIPFALRSPSDAWSHAETEVLAGAMEDADELSWETGVTAHGDAQFYVLGPLPEQACELCVSRVGGRFLLEDGVGRPIVAHHSLAVVAMHLRRAMRTSRWKFAARLIAVWVAIRGVFHDRGEPVLIESEEAVLHVAPQLAALV